MTDKKPAEETTPVTTGTPGTTRIVCIVDRSGSMQGAKEDAIGGFNSFLEKQQAEPGACLLTYVQFDHEYEVVHDGIDIHDMKPLDETTFVPRGNTALLDAIGRGISTVSARIEATPVSERPDHVVLVILTDGGENHSREFARFRVQGLVEDCTQKKGWKVIYLAQGIEAFDEAARMGLDPNQSNTLCALSGTGGQGMRKAYAGATYAVSELRSKGSYNKSDTSKVMDETE